jgi:zinc resistance-associated protein
MMKKGALIGLVVAVSLFLVSAGYACWNNWYGDDCGMSYGTSSNVESMHKFQQETLSLRDKLMTKNLELQNEYSKPVPDTNRIARLRKEIIDLQVKIQNIKDKYGLPTWNSRWGMMDRGRMMDMCPGDCC